MRTIVKSGQTIVKAWQLGQNSRMEQKLIQEGKIRIPSPGHYELFSQEAQGEIGQRACAGDYFKVDNAGFPYPNDKTFFEANHESVGGDEYRQYPIPLKAWILGDPMNEVISFLQQHKELQVDPSQTERCFKAPLWGSILTAAADAILVIYRMDLDEAGQILDVDFNFVARQEFEQTYRFVEKD